MAAPNTPYYCDLKLNYDGALRRGNKILHFPIKLIAAPNTPYDYYLTTLSFPEILFLPDRAVSGRPPLQ